MPGTNCTFFNNCSLDSLEQIQKSPQVHAFLTRLQCSPTSDGSAAVVLASESFVRSNHLEHKAVEIIGMEMTTDPSSTFTKDSIISVIGKMILYYNYVIY